MEASVNHRSPVLGSSSRLEGITSILWELIFQYLSVPSSRCFKPKDLYDLGPGYLWGCFLHKKPSQPLRSAGQRFLSVPPAAEIGLACIREMAFSIVAPQFWNSLLRVTRLTLCLYASRRHVKLELTMRN